MLRHVVVKELEDCLYGYRSLLIFVVSVVLFSLSIVTGARQYQASLSEYHLAEVALRQTLNADTTLWTFSSTIVNYVKPPAVLGILVSGAELLTPRVYDFSLLILPTPHGSAVSENPTLALFGSLDLAFIVEIVLGLAALIFTFSAICGEKETGTLKLQLANALPKDVLLVGKLGGNLIGLLVPVLLAFLLSCLILPMFSDVALTAGEWLRIALLGLNFALCLTVLFALGLCISTLTTRSTTSFGLCLAAWVLFVAIVPKVASIVSDQLAPPEPLQEFQMKKAEVDRRGTMEFQQEYAAYLSLHGGQPMSGEAYEDLEKRVREEQNQALAKLDDEYVRRKQQEESLAVFLSRLSPAGSASYAAMSLAGTGLDRDFRFRDALRQYRTEFTSYYDRKSRELLAMAGGNREGPRTRLYRFTDLPPFEFSEEPLSVSLDRALPDMGLLVAWALFFFAIAYLRFLRYDVR